MILTIIIIVMLCIDVVLAVIGIIICYCRRVKEFDELKYKKIRSSNIIVTINEFYKKKLEQGFNHKNPLLFRKAELESKLALKLHSKELAVVLIPVLIGSVLTDFLEKELPYKVIVFILCVILFLLLHKSELNSLDDVESEAYKYELDYINEILSQYISTIHGNTL